MKGYVNSRTSRALAFALVVGGETFAQTSSVAPNPHPFVFETLVDFIDDALLAGRPIAEKDIDAMMDRFAELGVKRVEWIYYGDGHGGFVAPAGYLETLSDGAESYAAFAETYRRLVNPLAVAVKSGHRHGLEVYAYYKPYETGPGIYFPEGSPEAKRFGVLGNIGGKLVLMDPFVRNHPDLRIKRRTDDLPVGIENSVIASIRLAKSDSKPTRITGKHLQIWTSPDNWRYQQKKVAFAFNDAVETAAADVRDNRGNLLTRKGDAIRVLTLSGLSLADKYVLVTTDFDGGEADFSNAGTALITALDPAGRVIKGVVADGKGVWAQNLIDFRTKGLMFDYGWGAAPVTLDAPNRVIPEGAGQSFPDLERRSGFIAFARGRNAYLPTALCETEPAVREFWLRCVDEMIAAGVDGVDFREENHSTMLDTPEDYGFNDIVLARARALPGGVFNNMAKVRGDAYTAFLEEAHQHLAKAGKVMRYNLQIDWFRPNPPYVRRLAYPAHVDFQWQRWIDEGLLDGAILRFFTLPFECLYTDPIAQEMIRRALDHKMTLAVNQYLGHAGDRLSDEVHRIKTDGRFNSFIYYESQSYLKFGAVPGDVSVANPALIKAATDNR